MTDRTKTICPPIFVNSLCKVNKANDLKKKETKYEIQIIFKNNHLFIVNILMIRALNIIAI